MSLLDVATENPHFYDWSAGQLELLAETRTLVINPLIYAEVSVGFTRIEEVDKVLPPEFFTRDAIPYEAGFLAGKCFLQYRRRAGKKTSPLPDFLIGAHAAVQGYDLLTRDASRFRTYFPSVRIIAP